MKKFTVIFTILFLAFVLGSASAQSNTVLIAGYPSDTSQDVRFFQLEDAVRTVDIDEDWAVVTTSDDTHWVMKEASGQIFGTQNGQRVNLNIDGNGHLVIVQVDGAANTGNGESGAEGVANNEASVTGGVPPCQFADGFTADGMVVYPGGTATGYGLLRNNETREVEVVDGSVTVSVLSHFWAYQPNPCNLDVEAGFIN